jgi:hypothetical protein
MREEDSYADKDIFESLRKDGQKWKSNIQEDSVFLNGEKCSYAEKECHCGFWLFYSSCQGFPWSQNEMEKFPWKLSESYHCI